MSQLANAETRESGLPEGRTWLDGGLEVPTVLRIVCGLYIPNCMYGGTYSTDKYHTRNNTELAPEEARNLHVQYTLGASLIGRNNR